MNKSIRFLFIVLFFILFTINWGNSILAQGWRPEDISPENLVQAKVHRLIMDPNSEKPVIILTDGNEKQALMI